MTTPDENLDQYIVRLVMKVDAPKNEPDSAVRAFVDNLVANGMREWVFRVEDIHTGEVLGYFDGFGDPVDISTPVPSPEEPAQEQAAEPEPAAGESDEDLEALAESLNGEG